MRRAMAYEWHALWSLRYVRVALALANLVVAVGAVGLAAVLANVPIEGMGNDDLLGMLLRMNMMLPVGITIATVTVMTGDVRRGMVLGAILRARGRGRVWLARTAVACTVALVLALVSLVVNVLAVTTLVGPLSPSAVGQTLVGGAAFAVGWALVAAGVGCLVRRPAVAVAVPLLAAYLLEPLVRSALGLASSGLVRLVGYLPFGAATALVGNTGPEAAAHMDVLVSAPVSAAVFLGFAAAVVVAGWHSFRNGDLEPVVSG